MSSSPFSVSEKYHKSGIFPVRARKKTNKDGKEVDFFRFCGLFSK